MASWFCERAIWSYLAHSGLPAVSRKKNFPESQITNRLLTKLVRLRWLDISLVLFFCKFMDLDSVSVHKHAKNLGQYAAILASHLVNNLNIYDYHCHLNRYLNDHFAKQEQAFYHAPLFPTALSCNLKSSSHFKLLS